MGWASASGLVVALIEATERSDMSKDSKLIFYTDLIEAFESSDWDTQDEAMGYSKQFDKALKQLHPDWD